MADLRIKDVDEHDIDTVLAEDIDFAGELSFSKPLMIKGRFTGQVQATGDLYVGDHAAIDATIQANVVSLKGSLKGNIIATSRVELFSTATVEGDIAAPDIVMESGCNFNGMCRMQVRAAQSERKTGSKRAKNVKDSADDET